MGETYLLCKFRQRVPLDKRILENREKLLSFFNTQALTDGGPVLLPESPGSTDPCCVHKDAPWVPFGGIRDPFLCEVTILGGRCPLGHQPSEVDPNWRQNNTMQRCK